MLIYDLEIKHAIPDAKTPREAGIIYCQGWTDFAAMGISVLCSYDYTADAYQVFCEDNLAAFADLTTRHDCVVGFNNRRFDDAVLSAAGHSLNANCYDLYEAVQRGLGLDFNNPAQRRAGYGLDALAFANFGTRKNGDGAKAAIHWQQGLRGQVISYCLNDVRLTKKLLDRVIRCGSLKDPHDTNKLIPIRRP